MAKTTKVLCTFCETKLTAGVAFCVRCGRPTRWATHEERTTWEVWQWQRSQRARATHPASGTHPRRLTPAPTMYEPAPFEHTVRAGAASRAAVAVATAPERVLVAVPAPKKAASIVPSPEAVEAPSSEPVASERVTVLALRLLNERVAELDDEVRRLQKQNTRLRSLRRALFGR